MPIRLEHHNIAYYPVPKVASTSIKLALFEADHDVPWVERAGNHIHHHWRGIAFQPLPANDTAWRFTVIRDPLERFYSAFLSRGYGELRKAAEAKPDLWSALGVKLRPTLSEFLTDFDLYRPLSPGLMHHLRPQAFSIGMDLKYYNAIYRFENLAALKSDLSALCKKDVPMPEANKRVVQHRPKLSKMAMAKFIELYTADYILLRDYYQPPRKPVS